MSHLFESGNTHRRREEYTAIHRGYGELIASGQIVGVVQTYVFSSRQTIYSIGKFHGYPLRESHRYERTCIIRADIGIVLGRFQKPVILR